MLTGWVYITTSVKTRRRPWWYSGHRRMREERRKGRGGTGYFMGGDALWLSLAILVLVAYVVATVKGW